MCLHTYFQIIISISIRFYIFIILQKMSNFNKLKQMWESKNKQPERVVPPPPKAPQFKSTFQVNMNAQSLNQNNHNSLPLTIQTKKIDVNIDQDKKPATVVQQKASENCNKKQKDLEIKQVKEVNHQKQMKDVKETKDVNLTIGANNIKKSNQETKIKQQSGITNKQIQRPKTMVPQGKQEPKINKISQIKNLFQGKMPMGFQNSYQPVRITQVNKPKEQLKYTETEKQHKHTQPHHQQTGQTLKSNNTIPNQAKHSTAEVSYQQNKISFQERRKMAQEMLKNKQMIAAKISHDSKIQHKTIQIQSHHHHSHQTHGKKDNVIKLDEQVYYFDQESRQATHKADILSNNIFMSALNKKPFYETNEGSVNNPSQIQKRPISEAVKVTDLKVRKQKKKKRNLQDFDDA